MADDSTKEKHVQMAECTKGDESGSTPERRKNSLQKVLIAVDGSGTSNRAVDWYLDELHKPGNQVIFLHSFELPLMYSYQEMSSSPDLWTATLKHEAERTAHLEKVLMRKTRTREVGGKFVTRAGGKAGQSILQAVEEEDADMIVMGTRGHGKVMRALLGSVSHYVMSHAHCPVLVYRDKKTKPRSASPEGEGRENKDKESEAAPGGGNKKGKAEKQKENKED